ncbi:hypothetical protein LSTR_LSTR003002 [Laodelphax striatellus]|uniref:Uncharacterized protein n=1 Tax=Laodelphax striatellus TaxID=195883 RepID=A0A482WT00_LAOST|nr:hypothetical protein LSTR_LSTR003002 [Laodelphax striatellus]
MTSLTIIITLAGTLLMQQGCNGQAATERQYFGSRVGSQAQAPSQPASVTEDQQEDQNQVRSRFQQEQQNFLAFVQQQGLLRQQPIQTAPAYPYVLSDATPRSSPEYQLAQLQYQQQILQQQQKVLQLQLQQQRLQAAQADRPASLAPQPEQYQQQQQKAPATLLGVAFSPATSVAHTRFQGNGINYQYR